MFSILLFTVFFLHIEFALSVDCESEWEKVGSKCLWKSSEKANRWENYKTCQRLGAVLVSPRTREENEEIKKYIGNNPGWYWLSGYQFVRKFIWIDGEEIKYDDWNPGQPNQLESEKGACIQINGVTGWDDDHCDNEYMQMCEKEIKTQPTVEEEKPKSCDAECEEKTKLMKERIKIQRRKIVNMEAKCHQSSEEPRVEIKDGKCCNAKKYEEKIKTLRERIRIQRNKVLSLQDKCGVEPE